MPNDIPIFPFASNFPFRLLHHHSFISPSITTTDTATITPATDGGIIVDPAEHVDRAHS